jgi:hypothetical protein
MTTEKIVMKTCRVAGCGRRYGALNTDARRRCGWCEAQQWPSPIDRDMGVQLWNWPSKVTP